MKKQSESIGKFSFKKIAFCEEIGDQLLVTFDDNDVYWGDLWKQFFKTIAIKSTDNTLKDLKLNGKTVVNFSPNTYSYSIQVEAITTTANIDAVLNSPTASFVENYGSRSVQLDYGENVIEIKVKAASNAEKTYVINVNRLDNRGTNNDLKSLILNSGKIKLNFDKDTLEYKIKTYKLDSIDIEALSVDEKATVKIEKPEEIIFG